MSIRNYCLVAAILAITCGMWLITSGNTQAFEEPPAAVIDEPQAPSTSASAIGGVHDFLRDPAGELVGVTLDDGTVAHWPGSAGTALGRILRPGEWIEVMGRRSVDSAGVAHVAVRRITNLATDVSLDVAISPAPPAIAPDAAQTQGTPNPIRREIVKEVIGVVDRYLANASGEIGGVQLSNGARIEWSPELTAKFREILTEGDEVQAKGILKTVDGAPILKAITVTNVRTGKSMTEESKPVRHETHYPNETLTMEKRLEQLQQQLASIQQEVNQLREQISKLAAPASKLR